MRKILIIGIGAGNPDHMTAQAVAALNRTDVVFLPDKGDDKDGLQKLRRDICARFIGDRPYRYAEMRLPERDIHASPDYKANIEAWRADVTVRYERFLRDELTDHQCGAFLAWGDPAIYDGTILILDAIRAKGDLAFEYDVIPGISSVQALAAAHRLPLNRIGESIHITTGRKLAAGWPADADNVVVMLDGRQAFKALGADLGLEIFWGAYVGTADEILIAGPLPDVAETICAAREAARQKHGWIMDSYLLRRRAP